MFGNRGVDEHGRIGRCAHRNDATNQVRTVAGNGAVLDAGLAVSQIQTATNQCLIARDRRVRDHRLTCATPASDAAAFDGTVVCNLAAIYQQNRCIGQRAATVGVSNVATDLGILCSAPLPSENDMRPATIDGEVVGNGRGDRADHAVV